MDCSLIVRENFHRLSFADMPNSTRLIHLSYFILPHSVVLHPICNVAARWSKRLGAHCAVAGIIRFGYLYLHHCDGMINLPNKR